MEESFFPHTALEIGFLFRPYFLVILQSGRISYLENFLQKFL